MIGMSLAEHLEHSNRPQWRLKGHNQMHQFLLTFFFQITAISNKLIVSKSTKCFDEKHFETFANLSRESPKRM